MDDDFHLIDLPSQALAVQRLLGSRTAAEKLAWLSSRGTVMPATLEFAGKPAYHFVSSVGLECAFFIEGDEFVFICDNTTYTAK